MFQNRVSNFSPFLTLCSMIFDVTFSSLKIFLQVLCATVAFLKTTRVEETAMQKMSLLVLKNWKNALETLQTLSAVMEKFFC